MTLPTHTTLRIALVLVAVAGFAALAAGSSTVTLDEETGLDEQSSIEQFADEGYVEVTNSAPKMEFAVAEDSEDVGVSALRYTNFDTIYLKVAHQESMERTVRLYVPAEYWHPHPDRLSAIDEDLTASMEPTGDGYSAIEVHFEGETEVVFPVKRQASLVFTARDYGSSWLENETGIQIPDLGGESDQWQYVPMQELQDADEPTFGIDTDGEDLTLQYDAANTADPTEQRWRSLPSCGSVTGGEQPVCHFRQQGSDDVVYVLAQADDPPDVRFKEDSDFLTDLRASVNEAVVDIPREAIADARDFISDLLS